MRKVNAVVKTGSCLALLGPSGSGKTTLLRAIAGFVRPEKGGTIKIFGNDMERKPAEHRPVSMLFQKPPLFDEKTVEDNSLFGLLNRKNRETARQQVRQLAEMFDFENFLKKKIKTLSGGERQRAAFIRAFANAKKIMLLDEPIHSAFDLHQRRLLMRAIKECARKENLTTIVVTHEYDEAAYLADEVLVLVDGESSGNTLREMYESPNNRNIAQILGYGNEIEAETILDDNLRAQKCPLRISGTLRNHKNASCAFFRPESVEVDSTGLGFIVESVIFSGAFNRLVLRAQHEDMLIEAIVSANEDYVCGDKVAAIVPAERIVFFRDDEKKAGE